MTNMTEKVISNAKGGETFSDVVYHCKDKEFIYSE